MSAALAALGVALATLLGVSLMLRRAPIGLRPVDPRATSSAPAFEQFGNVTRWWRRRAGRRRFGRELPRLVESIARELRAGATPRAALLDGATAAGSPFRDDAERLARRLEAGVPLDEVLRWWAQHRHAPELARVALLARCGGRWGGGVADALEGLAAAMDDRREIAAEARAHSSQARASAVLLVAAPVVFCVVMAAVDPRSTRFLLTTPAGWATLVAALGLDAVGAGWMHRLTARVR